MFNGALTPKLKPPINKPTPPNNRVPVKTVDSLGGYNDKYLRKENFLGEYLSDNEKAIVRDNLGINVGDLLLYVKDLAGQEIAGGSPVISYLLLLLNQGGIRSVLRNSPTGSVIVVNDDKSYFGKINTSADEVLVAFLVVDYGKKVDYILHLNNNNLISVYADYIEYN